MLQQDYFIRIIREFFAALARALEKNEVKAQSEAIHELYQQYLGSYEFYQNATLEEAMDRIRLLYPKEQQIQRMEMLAELYYAEADLRPQPIGETLLARALPLFEYVDLHSGVFSILRTQKIDAIRRRINAASAPEDH